jgi:hypothetical protein
MIPMYILLTLFLDVSFARSLQQAHATRLTSGAIEAENRQTRRLPPPVLMRHSVRVTATFSRWSSLLHSVNTQKLLTVECSRL